MKRTLSLVIVVFTAKLLYAQFQGMPTPGSFAEYEEINRELAAEYAPIFYHQIETQNSGSPNFNTCDQTSHDPLGMRDLITPMNFDGDWVMDNNWQNFYCILNSQNWIGDEEELSQREEFKPIIYYSVAWLESELVINYTYFHPVDWSNCEEPIIYDGFDQHENDTEGVIVYVSRINGEVTKLSTIYHNDILHYDSPTIVNGNHVGITIDNETHSAIDLSESPSGNLLEDGCTSPFDFIITYSFAGDENEAYLDYNNSEAGYELVSIVDESELWDQRNNSFTMTQNSQQRNRKLIGDDGAGNDKAKPPWSWPVINLLTPCGTSSTNFYLEYNPYENGHIYHETVSEDDCPFDSNERRTVYIKSNTLWEGVTAFRHNIVIDSDVELIIRNSNLNLSGKITVESGASLIIDNSILDRIGGEGKWKGISAPELFYGYPAFIKIINNSFIRNSEFGISNSQNFGTISFNGNGTVIPNGTYLDLYIEESDFQWNDVPLSIIETDGFLNIDIKGSSFFGSDYPATFYSLENNIVNIDDCTFSSNEFAGLQFWGGNSENIVNACSFFNNDIGIRVYNNNGLNVTNGFFFGSFEQFNDYSVGINLIESTTSIKNNNHFLHNFYGVLIEGTYPLSAGVELGSMQTQHNFFEKNYNSINSSGSDHPVGARIINNLIDHTNGSTFYGLSGLSLSGANNAIVRNNSIISAQSGFFAGSTGDNLNLFSCNDFQNSIAQDQAIQGQNNNSRILENHFTSPDVAWGNINLYGAELFGEQGLTSNPAANCFTPSAPYRLTADDNTESFIYHYFDDTQGNVACQVPDQSQNYQISAADVPGDNCLGEIGIFNFGGGGGGDEEVDDAIIPPSVMQDPFCKSCIMDSISHWTDQVIMDAGDNPYTDTNEGGNFLILSEILLRNWIDYGIYIGLATDDYNYLEQLLSPIKVYRYRIRLFGVYIKSNQYSKARNLLSQLPINTIDRIYFKDVQEINLDRLTDTNGNYELNNLDKQRLELIALSQTSSSGYARSLYHLLTGEMLDLEIPLPDIRITPRSNSDKKSDLIFYPNPANDEISINTEKSLFSINLFDATGNIVFRSKGINLKTINTEELSEGIYFIEFKFLDGRERIDKVLIIK